MTRALILCLFLAGCGGNIGGKWIRYDCPEPTCTERA